MNLSGSLTALAALALLAGLLLFPEKGGAQTAPTISGETSLSFPENTAITTVLTTYTATDADTDPLMWSLGGDDSGDFTLTENAGNTGRELKFMAVPNYETPADQGGDNTYNVTVNVEDDEGMSATLMVTVSVTNVDEDGTVTITGTLSGGEELTAAVTDIDGAVSGLTWQWARGDSASGPFSDIGTETSADYTSVAADVGKYLRATASYTDPEGSGKSANAVSSAEVEASNSEPEFSAETAIRTLPENSGAGVNVVGGTTAATDSDSGDTLIYSLTGTDAESFEIDSNGQLKTRTGVSHNFNFEATKNSYSVTVSVHDGKDAAGDTDTTTTDATITVTIESHQRGRGRHGDDHGHAVRGRRVDGGGHRHRRGRQRPDVAVGAGGTRPAGPSPTSVQRPPPTTRRWPRTWASTCGPPRPTPTLRVRASPPTLCRAPRWRPATPSRSSAPRRPSAPCRRTAERG